MDQTIVQRYLTFESGLIISEQIEARCSAVIFMMHFIAAERLRTRFIWQQPDLSGPLSC